VYVAGDDDQALFRFAGADVDEFLALQGDQLVLEQSYRLPRTVHSLCSGISARISKRFAKKWRPRDDEGSVEYLSSLRDIEWREGTYMFLARNRYLLDNVEYFVRTSGIPYTYGKRSSVDPNDAQAIRAWEYLRRGDAVSAADVRKVYACMATGTGVARGHKRLDALPDDQLLTLQELKARHGLRRDDIWHEALERITSEDREFYLAALRRGEKLTRTPRVTISTIHGVKGGEADNVVVLSDMAARTFQEYRNDPDDEHRVAYVAASRARRHLSILLPQSQRAYDYR
jgi:DNA helicase-2/ATP-dependent DNA helicase PcrA